MDRSHGSNRLLRHAVRLAWVPAVFAFVLASAATKHIVGTTDTMPPERLTFSEGHAMMGSDTITWKAPHLLFIATQPTMDGSGHVRESRRAVRVSADAWKHFWSRTETLGVWRWRATYASAESSRTDGSAWSLELSHAGHSVSSKGYNAYPESYGAFREALHALAPASAKK